ncbi:HNH endonuclease [Acinetobacter baumannii]|nr:HNH endonuclease [Acinetobacter baumannii]
MKYLNNFKSTLPCNWLKQATNSRKMDANELSMLENSLSTSYSDYDSLILQYQIKPAASQYLQHKDLLHSYYNSAPTKLNNSLLERRNNHGLLYCPYCGDPKKPDTLDHFVPKDDWPEFSIFPNNLVPQCRACAPIKGTKYFCDISNISKFIHPIYFDSLDKIRFEITVIFNKDTLNIVFNIKYRLVEQVDATELTRIKYHIQELNINSRIKKFGFQEFYFWRDKLLLKKFNIRDALNQRLKEVTSSNLSRDWKTALYKGMLDNIDLINYYDSITPIDNKNFDNTDINKCNYITID